MARQFEKRDKKVQKMTRDGLVEQNLATGEESRISQRGQDFNLRGEAPPGRQPGTAARESSQMRYRRPIPSQDAETFSTDAAQTPDFRQDGYSPDGIDSSAPSVTGSSGFSPERTAPSAPVSSRQHDPPGREPETTRQQHRIVQRRFAKNIASEPAFSSPDTPMEAARPVEHDIGARSRETSASDGSSPGVDTATKRPGRLRDTEGAVSSAPSGKSGVPTSHQRGTNNHQRFAQVEVRPETGGAPKEAEAAADSPDASNTERPHAASETPHNTHGKPSRLRFTKNERPPGSPDGGRASSPDKKLQQAQHKAERVGAKLETARGKLPTKKKLKRALDYDEQKNKVKRKLQFEKVPLAPGENRFKPPAVVAAPAAVAKGMLKTAGRGIHTQFHRKMYQVENENVGIQAAHKAELLGETALRGGARSVRSAYRFVRNTPYRTVEKLEKQAMKANVKLSYRKALAENPQLKSNLVSRFIQKRKIKQAYANAARDAKKAGTAVKKTGSIIGNAAKAVAGFVKRHPMIAGIIALILLLFFFFSSMLTSCSNMASGMLSTVVGSSYTAKDRDIDDAELNYTDWETGLMLRVNNSENDFPGYDEYRYNVDDIGHDPFELMAFLTTVYQDFTYAEVQSVLQEIFAEQYQLTFTPEVETRYRTETRTGSYTDTNGNLQTYTYEVEVPYEWHSLNVTLTARSFSDVIAPRMDAAQREMFEVYMQTKGNRQYVENPFDINWLPLVTDPYGWRIHPVSGARDYHMGVDIGVPVGTEIHAGMDGVVTAAAYDAGAYGWYIVIANDKGVEAKYAHCDGLLASVGQEVKKGDVIALSGNTGSSAEPHLHLEVLKDGAYLNPIYFAQTGDDGSGRILPGSPGGVSFPEYPGEPMGEGTYAALMEEAQKHLGKPYVFGAKGPDKFDCSGFVCWSLANSGVKDISTNAQGLFNASTPISGENAQPGDLIFFQGTYSTSNTVTHVGIYIGNGMMIHAGKPIQYASIDTRYWEDHFYSFGRIAN